MFHLAALSVPTIFLQDCNVLRQRATTGIQNIKKGNEKKPIYIGMKMIADDEIAVKMHIPMTKNAGATRDEAKTTVLSGWSVIGTKSESKYLPLVLESYDENRQI